MLGLRRLGSCAVGILGRIVPRDLASTLPGSSEQRSCTRVEVPFHIRQSPPEAYVPAEIGADLRCYFVATETTGLVLTSKR